MLDLPLERAAFDPPGKDRFLTELGKRSPLIRDGFDYWQSKGWPDRIPFREDIKPFEIPKLIPNIVIIDVLKDPLDFQYRLMGTAVVERLSCDRTGQKMSEIPFQRAPSKIWNNCKDVAETGYPVLTDVPYVGPYSDFMQAQDLVLPLSGECGSVNKLLVFVDYIAKSDI